MHHSLVFVSSYRDSPDSKRLQALRRFSHGDFKWVRWPSKWRNRRWRRFAHDLPVSLYDEQNLSQAFSSISHEMISNFLREIGPKAMARAQNWLLTWPLLGLNIQVVYFEVHKVVVTTMSGYLLQLFLLLVNIQLGNNQRRLKRYYTLSSSWLKS